METSEVIIKKNSNGWDWRYASLTRWNELKGKLIMIEGFHRCKGIFKRAYGDSNFYNTMGMITIPNRGDIPYYLGGTNSVTIYPEEERIIWVLLNT